MPASSDYPLEAASSSYGVGGDNVPERIVVNMTVARTQA